MVLKKGEYNYYNVRTYFIRSATIEVYKDKSVGEKIKIE
jgi:hypothetical protein